MNRFKKTLGFVSAKTECQRMVIVPSFSQRLGWILLLAFTILFGFIGFISLFVVPIVISVVLGIYTLANLRGRKVAIAKLTQSITLDERRFLLMRRQHIILFSAVMSVDVDKKNIWFFDILAIIENFPSLIRGMSFSAYPAKSKYDAWQVSLNIGGEKVKIDRTTNARNMVNLANKVSQFIGKELVDKSPKPKPKVKKIYPPLTQPYQPH